VEVRDWLVEVRGLPRPNEVTLRMSSGAGPTQLKQWPTRPKTAWHGPTRCPHGPKQSGLALPGLDQNRLADRSEGACPIEVRGGQQK